uniref:Uncharacterized protein n=1 Tax=Nelumbo nucifera TaxID=4432 RepID=A0A822Z941_NELNU|nr:TPA_asm: hypothetical protein HUJ06_015407 [Nelumbo nucifera]
MKKVVRNAVVFLFRKKEMGLGINPDA